ncbi:hypothetical protein PMAYCL1PPCAC_18526, partial [Pristionchus mayeri]
YNLLLNPSHRHSSFSFESTFLSLILFFLSSSIPHSMSSSLPSPSLLPLQISSEWVALTHHNLVDTRDLEVENVVVNSSARNSQSTTPRENGPTTGINSVNSTMLENGKMTHSSHHSINLQLNSIDHYSSDLLVSPSLHSSPPKRCTPSSLYVTSS